MLEWIYRGVSKRRITTRYPRRSAPAPARFHGCIDVTATDTANAEVASVCPTGAISVDADGRLALDRGRCILCGECVRAAPDVFTFRASYETAQRSANALIVGQGAADGSEHLEPARREHGEHARMLRRSIHIRHIDCGSDGSEEWEIQALWNPHYDIQRLGFFLTNSPRHADVLLVTGPVTPPMRGPLERTWEVMPEPKALVAVGTDACCGGLHGWGGVDQLLPVDVYVPGSPPAPIAIIDGLLLAVDVLAPKAVPA